MNYDKKKTFEILQHYWSTVFVEKKIRSTSKNNYNNNGLKSKSPKSHSSRQLA